MSVATKSAIYQKLKNDAILTGLIGSDENGDPAIYNASFNMTGNPVFPCVTFRESSGANDGRMIGSTVDTEYFDIEIWHRAESGLIVPRIAARIDALLHNQALAVGSGEAYDCSRVTQMPDQYDSKLRLHFGLYRYKVVVRV